MGGAAHGIEGSSSASTPRKKSAISRRRSCRSRRARTYSSAVIFSEFLDPLPNLGPVCLRILLEEGPVEHRKLRPRDQREQFHQALPLREVNGFHLRSQIPHHLDGLREGSLNLVVHLGVQIKVRAEDKTEASDAALPVSRIIGDRRVA